MRLTVGCFKWHTPGYRSVFDAQTVNTLFAMMTRHYHRPFEFVCVTDDATGIDPRVRIVPLWNDFAQLRSPHGGDGKNPSCYRRLKVFAPDADEIFGGDRLLFLDLDSVITADVTALFDRDEELVIYGDTNPQTYYNGSIILLKAGSRAKVWTEFDPETSPRKAKNAGFFGSDQAWISFVLGRDEAKFTKADGVYSYRNEIKPNGGRLPADARVVIFHGKSDPWSLHIQEQHPWVREHYRAEEVAA